MGGLIWKKLQVFLKFFLKFFSNYLILLTQLRTSSEPKNCPLSSSKTWKFANICGMFNSMQFCFSLSCVQVFKRPSFALRTSAFF